jgi:hypothetical protein
VGGENFPILKVPYCLYGKGCCREGKALGSEEVKCREMDFVMNRGETLKGVFTAGDRNFGVSVRKTKLLYFFYLIYYGISIGRAAREECRVPVSSPHCIACFTCSPPNAVTKKGGLVRDYILGVKVPK